ncbi:sulfur oxidation c-type cytochrome SoxA [Halorhodospira sp. 9622]|uniref:sulfur oxidation c-type cytochrome SoxA n=1 Tax=Halorhodospira sp. 9622 TaxID=2899136 RepID=UPI001EE80E80|nr:sulfur oxidation c-type cytochrome SoxA [Halorhodospira sp. 9622]MCG5537663.1 sulfur oxidation c-type cytochrome SoxA [Halorhodospira sp. 9622]
MTARSPTRSARIAATLGLCTGAAAIGLLATQGAGAGEQERNIEPRPAPDGMDHHTSETWESLATEPSQGRIVEEDGETRQIRYEFGGFPGEENEDFGDWPTHSYADETEYPEPQEADIPDDLEGDPERGRELFAKGELGPCSSCHLVPEAGIDSPGNVGTDLRTVGEWAPDKEWLYQVVYDPRVFYGEDSPMPPFGLSGMWSEEQIVDVVAYLMTLEGDEDGEPITPEGVDRHWDPNTRPALQPAGEHLDPFDNPALMHAEQIAVPLWDEPGPNGESCASCHGELEPADELRPVGVIEDLEGVAAEYPKWFDEYDRMMSIEDFLAVHAKEEQDMELPTQSDENLYMSLLVHSQSNGMAYDLDDDDPNVQAAIERGEALFHRPVGERAHACANCHTDRGGGDKWLSGRILANIEAEDTAMSNHPYWRTAQSRVWDLRTRFQWCMTPLGTNYLPGDAPEYADLETYLISEQQGEEVLVPRYAH